MAEGIARRIIVERGLSDMEARSAGTSAWGDAPASDGALLVAMEHGVDLAEHRARTLSAELVQDADLILTMGPHHLDRAEALGGAGKSFLLTDFTQPNDTEKRAVNDPFGGDLDVYRTTFEELEREIAAAIDRIVEGRKRQS